MKKQLLFNLTKFLSQKTTSKMAAFAVLMLMTVQSSFAQSWPILGNETAVSSILSSNTSIAVVADVPYVVYVETLVSGTSGAATTGLAKVKKRLADGTWVQVGPNLSASLATYTRIYADAAGNLYVAYIDGAASSKLIVKKYNTGTQLWDTVGGAGVYVSTGSATNVVSQFSSTYRCSMAFDSTNTPYIAYIDATNSLAPVVKKFDGTNWVTVGSAVMIPAVLPATPVAAIAHSVSLVIDGSDVPWLAFVSLSGTGSNTGSMALYQFTGGTWTAATALTLPGGIRHTTIGLNSAGNPVIVYFDAAGTTPGPAGLNKATAIEYDKTANTWGAITRLGARDSTNITMVKDTSGNLYCSFIDAVTSTFLQSARVFKLAAGATFWTELKDPNVARGIDEPAGNISMAVGNGSTVPFVLYTKANLAANIVTPIVRKYTAPVGTAPAITNFSPSLATTPIVSTTFTISGINFTGATAVTYAGNPITTFTVTNDTSITWTAIPAAATDSSVSVTTPNGTATITGTPPSGLSYASVPSTYTGTPLVPTVTAAGTLIYSITPTLPAGMSFNLGTGVIGGQATAAVPSNTYTVTATNNYGSTTTTATFGTAGVAPAGLTYTVPAGYATNTAITALNPTITLNGGSPTYTVSPSLPTGLALDPATGIISGTPTAVTASTVYTVKATTEFGFVTKAIVFATGDAPSAFSYTPAPSTSYIQGTAITPLVTVITPGTGTPVYSVTPALPTGLTLDTVTGGISGTPTTVTASTAYTVKATTIYGNTTNVITFSVDSNLATDSFEKSDAVKAYPNPTADTVTVSLPNAAVVQKIAVYNSLGQLVRTETKNSVSLQNLANGNYYLTIYTSEGNYSKKIIKK